MLKRSFSFLVYCLCITVLILQESGCRSAPDIATLNEKGESSKSRIEHSTKSNPNARVIEWIVAVVNQEIILHSDLEQAVLSKYKSEPNPPIDSEAGRKRFTELRPKVLQEMIDQMLILQQSEDPNIIAILRQFPGPPYEKVIGDYKELIKKENHLTDEQFSQALKESGITEVEWQKNIYKQYRLSQILNITVDSRLQVTDEEVRLEYDQKTKQAGVGDLKVHLLHLLIPITSNASTSEMEDKQRLATELTRKLQAGQDFQALAKEYQEQGIPKEVDVGFVSLADLPNELKQTIPLMIKNEIRGPLRSERGFHIIKFLEKKNEDVRPFEEAKEDIRKELLNRRRETAITSWVHGLRRKSYIDIRLNDLTRKN